MENYVFIAVLVAAALHAGWNSTVKLGIDRVSAVLLLAIVQAAVAIPILPFIQLPTAAAIPWIIFAAVLHTGYKVFLVQAYANADLSQVYPLARGTAPLIVTLFSIFVLGVSFGNEAMIAILLISAGILLMAIKGNQVGRMSNKAVFYAIGTAGFTASYTLVDGLGARIAETSSGFILWMVIGDAIGMVIFAFLVRGPSAFSLLLPNWKIGSAAGIMSLGSYWIAIWAFTQAPIALVATLRESSILFATLIAVFILREDVTRWRLIAVGFIAAGGAMHESW